jgi:hypothetical protein
MYKNKMELRCAIVDGALPTLDEPAFIMSRITDVEILTLAEWATGAIHDKKMEQPLQFLKNGLE